MPQIYEKIKTLLCFRRYFFKLKIKAIREAGSLWNDPQGKFVII